MRIFDSVFFFESVKKHNKRTKVDLDTKSRPLEKGSTKTSAKRDIEFNKKHRVNLDMKVDPLGKGQLKNRQKRDIYFEWLL